MSGLAVRLHGRIASRYRIHFGQALISTVWLTGLVLLLLMRRPCTVIIVCVMSVGLCIIRGLLLGGEVWRISWVWQQLSWSSCDLSVALVLSRMALDVLCAIWILLWVLVIIVVVMDILLAVLILE